MDPDPHQNVMDPQHCCLVSTFVLVQEVKELPPGGTTAQLQQTAHGGFTAEKTTDDSEPWLLQQADDGGTLLEIAAQIIEGGRP